MNTPTGKIALVTGANRGLGRSMALHLAAQGVDVIGTFRNNEEEAKHVVSEIEALGQRGAMLQLEVGLSASFAAFAIALAETLQTRFERNSFDYLINNAGVGGHSLIADLQESQFDELVNVHFKGPVFLTQRLLPMIVDGGRIVNISTGLARFAHAGASVYASNKGAIEVFTRYLAKELGPRGITANVIAPGAIATDFNGGRVRDNETVNQQVAATIALGRVGVPDDVGAAVAALLSDGGRWINGQRIEVSGGQQL
ncbi:MAG: SDR family oxidoreductase [Phycisphaerae bacterium]|nr:SDR family oxidoreductase [Gemmatimonadaceae bacterium]